MTRDLFFSDSPRVNGDSSLSLGRIESCDAVILRNTRFARSELVSRLLTSLMSRPGITDQDEDFYPRKARNDTEKNNRWGRGAEGARTNHRTNLNSIENQTSRFLGLNAPMAVAERTASVIDDFFRGFPRFPWLKDST
jgi:hypothetical protein